MLVLTHKKHAVVAGVRWIPMAKSDLQLPKTEIAEAIRSSGIQKVTHGVVLRSSDGRSWCGLIIPGSAPAAARSGVSGAAWIAHLAHDDNVLLIQSVTKPDRSLAYWIVETQRGGGLNARTDIIESEDAAVQRIDDILREAYNTSEPLRVLVGGESPRGCYSLDQLPQEDDIPVGERAQYSRRVGMTFAQFVGDEVPPAEAKIRQIAGVSRLVIYLCVLVMVCFAIMVGTKLFLDKRKRDAELARMQAEIAAQQISQQQIASEREARIAKAVAEALAVDTATAPPGEAIAACIRAFESLGGDSLSGWSVERAECTPGTNPPQLRASLNRREMFATNASLAAIADDHRWTVSINESGQQAAVTILLGDLYRRPAMLPPQLPSGNAFVLLDGSRAQEFDVSAGTVTQLQAAVPKSITFVDPEREQSSAANERFQPVPEESGYRVGKIKTVGSGLWFAPSAPLDQPYITVERVVMTPGRLSPAGDKYELEAVYVVSP